jgi:hypothetical protein
MEKEGASTLDRPRSISVGETLSGGMRTLTTPAGERFKKMRRYVVPFTSSPDSLLIFTIPLQGASRSPTA